MSSELFDPDLKINMSLDQIIQLTKSKVVQGEGNQLRGRFLNGVKKKKSPKRKGNPRISEHSVPLMTSLGGGYTCLTKKSLLLGAENKRKIAMAVSNRIVNTGLIEKTKEIIPASYMLVKTTTGVERVLVPVEGYIINMKRKETTPSFQFLKPPTINNPPVIPQPEKPVPLTRTPIFNMSENHSANNQFMKMEVDGSDDEVTILSHVIRNQNGTVVTDVEPNSQALNLDNKAHQAVSQKPIIKTLNDRFTLLTSGIDL